MIGYRATMSLKGTSGFDRRNLFLIMTGFWLNVALVSPCLSCPVSIFPCLKLTAEAIIERTTSIRGLSCNGECLETALNMRLYGHSPALFSF